MTRHRALLLEDDLALRDLLLEALGGEGFEVHACDSFEQVLEAAASGAAMTTARAASKTSNAVHVLRCFVFMESQRSVLRHDAIGNISSQTCFRCTDEAIQNGVVQQRLPRVTRANGS